jgi:hypothetical protein
MSINNLLKVTKRSWKVMQGKSLFRIEYSGEMQ